VQGGGGKDNNKEKNNKKQVLLVQSKSRALAFKVKEERSTRHNSLVLGCSSLVFFFWKVMKGHVSLQ
jgi:hypothetical protein